MKDEVFGMILMVILALGFLAAGSWGFYQSNRANFCQAALEQKAECECKCDAERGASAPEGREFAGRTR